MRLSIEKRLDLGELGESLVKTYFEKQGFFVSLSSDPYDEDKDLIIDGNTAEVKTQTIYNTFPFPEGKAKAFTIPVREDSNVHRNQLSKCLNVDKLFFVARPDGLYGGKVRIFEAPSLGDRKFCLVQNSLDKRYVAGFKVSSMSLVAEFTSEKVVKAFL